MKKALLPIALVSLLITNLGWADDEFTPEEQELIKAGATMELFNPTQHHQHYIDTLTTKNGASSKVVVIVFGTEDAAPARSEGTDMRNMHYSAHQAEMFLFAEGWDKYKPDRFFTRAYVQEGMDAFEGVRHQK